MILPSTVVFLTKHIGV